MNSINYSNYPDQRIPFQPLSLYLYQPQALFPLSNFHQGVVGHYPQFQAQPLQFASVPSYYPTVQKTSSIMMAQHPLKEALTHHGENQYRSQASNFSLTSVKFKIVNDHLFELLYQSFNFNTKKQMESILKAICQLLENCENDHIIVASDNLNKIKESLMTVDEKTGHRFLLCLKKHHYPITYLDAEYLISKQIDGFFTHEAFITYKYLKKFKSLIPLEVMENMFKLFAKSRDTAKAIYMMKEILEVKPQIFRYYNTMFCLYLKDSMFDEMYALFTQIKDQYSLNDKVGYRLIHEFFLQGRVEQAVEMIYSLQKVPAMTQENGEDVLDASSLPYGFTYLLIKNYVSKFPQRDLRILVSPETQEDLAHIIRQHIPFLPVGISGETNLILGFTQPSL